MCQNPSSFQCFYFHSFHLPDSKNVLPFSFPYQLRSLDLYRLFERSAISAKGDIQLSESANCLGNVEYEQPEPTGPYGFRVNL